MQPILEKSAEFLTPLIKGWAFNLKPLIISVSGPQGSGKSFLSSKLTEHLRTVFPDLSSAIVSTDDLYLTHKDQQSLSASDPENALLRGRGLPGTHDVEMAFQLLTKLSNKDTGFAIPRYDKSLFGGEGDRSPKSEWTNIEKPVDIVILEGWFNGFTPIADGREIEARYNNSALLQKYRLQDIYTINASLDSYVKLWGFVDADIFYDTDDINNVYTWRQEQEDDLIKRRGSGMTNEQVRSFIDRYMVVYELYFRDFVMFGVPSLPKNTHLRLKLNLQRGIDEAEIF